MTYVYRHERGTRAVSVVIGVALMMSILFLAAAQYQLVIVPQQEEATEIDHHRLVESQMGQLHADILAASSNSAISAQKLNAGVEYSRDLIFGIIPEVHHPNPSGQLENRDFSKQIIVKNAEGIGSARNYWPGGLDGNECGDPNHCYDTTSFHFKADYSRYTDSPEIVYENTLYYDYYDTNNNDEYDAGDDYQIHSNQFLVQGRALNLVALTGSLQQSRVSPTTLQTIPVSAPAQTITVRQDASGDPLTVQIPSRIPATIWENQLLANQMAASNPDGYVDDVASCGPECIEITMVEGEVYNMKLSRVHLTTREEQTELPVEKAAYIAWKGNERITIRENSTTEISAQVRDRYNNAVPGIRTKAFARDSSDNCIGSFRSGFGNTCSTSGGATVQQAGEQTSGEDGTLTYYYEAPDVDSDTAITIQLLLDDPSNTVSAELNSPEPELVSVTSPAVSTPIRQDVRVGHINDANTLRIIDVSFDMTSVNAKRNTYAFVTLDNTGTSTISKDIAITGSGGLQANPGTLSVDIAPGEHKRYAVEISFRNAGTQTIQFGTHTVNIGVRSPSTGIAPAVINNRRVKERISKSPGRFKDGDPTRTEFMESQNIPPVQYDSTSGTYESSAVGNIYQFTEIGTTDSRYAHFDGDTTYGTQASLRTGLAIDRVADNEVYTLFVDYRFANGANDVRYNIVNATGHILDGDSNYRLLNEGGNTVRAYQLTDKETQYVRSSNVLYAVVNATSTSGSVPQLRVDRAWLISSPRTLTLSEPKTTLDPTSIGASSSSVQTGDPLIISANLTNTGTATVERTVAVFQSESGSVPEALRTHEVYVNPGETKRVDFVLYEYNPGTYSYTVGMESTPDTNPVQVDILHRPA